MSETYNIGCKKCKKFVWVGQGSYGDKYEGYLYTGEGKIEVLYKFLIDHKRHPLIFDNDQLSEFEDYVDVDA